MCIYVYTVYVYVYIYIDITVQINTLLACSVYKVQLLDFHTSLHCQTELSIVLLFYLESLRTAEVALHTWETILQLLRTVSAMLSLWEASPM